MPLDEVMADAKHGDHTHFELVTVTIRTSDGIEGTGYTYTGGFGGRAILAMVEPRPAALPDRAGRRRGRGAQRRDAVARALRRRAAASRRFAISAIDIALWDLRGKAEGRPLWQMAGGASNRSQAYRGGIDLKHSARAAARTTSAATSPRATRR